MRRRPTSAESRRDAQRWRDALLATLDELPDAPLLLSGGMDSLSILAGLVTLGRRPHCITYRLAHTYSPDMAVANRITRDLGVPHHQVLIPESATELRRAVTRAVRLVGARKTAVECAIPMGYLARFASTELGATSALVGDPGIIEDMRKYAVAVNVAGGVDTEETRVMRLRGYGTPGPGSAAMRAAAAQQDVALIGPFSMEPIASVGLGLEPYAINYPRQKGVALRAFPDVFGTWPYRYWKRNESLQTASGFNARVMAIFGVDDPRKMAPVYRAILGSNNRVGKVREARAE